MEESCGRKYSRAKAAYTRAKTRLKTICTRFGTIAYRFAYVKRKAGGFFSPLLEYLSIPKHHHMSKDLRNRLRDKASKMTYADSVEDIANSFSFQIHRQTLWRIVQESGGPPIIIEESNAEHAICIADGTKVRSTRGGWHEPKAIMSVKKPGSNEENGEECLLAFGVAESWEELAEGVDFSNFKVLVADAEPGLKHNLVKSHMLFQLCHLHAERDLSIYLWKGGLPKLSRNEFMKPFKNVLYSVQSTTRKYFRDKDKARLCRKLSWAYRQIDILAELLEERRLFEASEFLERNKKYFFTSAVLAVREDLIVPWTTNQVERLMKEIGKRTKKKSMRWSVNGLKIILQAVLKRYFLPPKKRNYKEIYRGDDTQ